MSEAHGEFMKRLLIGFLTLTSVSSFAGMPDEDPIVASLRTRFETATEPTNEYLSKHTFKCKEMNSSRGDFYKTKDYVNLWFEEFDGLQVIHQEYSIMSDLPFVSNGNELIGTTRSGRGYIVYEAYRVDSKGFLISEFSEDNEENKSLELLPLSSSKGKVASYTICVTK